MKGTRQNQRKTLICKDDQTKNSLNLNLHRFLFYFIFANLFNILHIFVATGLRAFYLKLKVISAEKAIPNQQVLNKLERVLGAKLRQKKW